MKEAAARSLASAIAYNCVRNNTPLEDFHVGVGPSSNTGDYSDVKVVTPYGEIPWNELSRISDEEMERLMRRVTDAIYTAMVDPRFLEPVPSYWAKPIRLTVDIPEDIS